ncbi:hypothetical protein JOD97_005648 [Duganella sp. 1411]|uniref:hypothetical protein n=1 Tax=Duganella sp. 1411 TaxID=2806572 RepID=UPI001AEAA30F|nr:hypothetical protein [Duganella sp. 1411]MBP1207565.1 hypothetical protein [Duganella sp. 1411]
MNRVSARLLAFCMLFWVAVSAHAEYAVVHGDNVDYYYDTRVYSAPTVVGNLVEFDISMHSQAGYPTAYRSDYFQIYATSHTGYVLNGGMTIGIEGTMQWPSSSSVGALDANARISLSTFLYSGTASGVDHQFYPTDLSSFNSHAEAVVNPTGNFDTSGTYSGYAVAGATGLYHTLGLINIAEISTDNNLNALVTLDKLRFDLGTQIAAPVPEADSYLMMAAGLLMVGATLKLRKRQG